MGKLTINANDVDGAVTVQIRYRVLGSGSSFTVLTKTPDQLPFEINGLSSAQYEVGVRSLCSNGAFSPWVAGQTIGCTPPVSFTAIKSGSNISVTATLAGAQTKIQVNVQDPNGGNALYFHDFGTQTGTFSIPLISGLYGDYLVTGSGICDSTVSPNYASAYTSAATVNNPSPTPNNISVNASFGMVFTDVRNGTASGIPTSFNNATISGTQSDYTASLSSGTISATLTGTVPAYPIYLRLVKNGVTIVSQVTITAAGTYTLTNSGAINSPDLISIEIDS
jgi:hypothetical protein